MRLTIGQLARSTGLTQRALRHYESVALLNPGRTAAGYRVYRAADVDRLARIRLLQGMGLSLAEIREVLEGPQDLAALLDERIDALEQRIEADRRLLERLVTARAECSAGRVKPDQLMQLLEVLTMYEKHFTQDQLKALAQRRETTGAERIREVEQLWQELFVEFESAWKMDRPVDDPQVARLAGKARDLIAEFTGGDAGIERSVGQMYQAEGPSQVLAPHGFQIDPQAFAYMQRAMAALPS